MYIIGIFMATNEVEVIPEDWMTDPATLVKSSTQCWWPPYKSSAKITKAVSTKEQVDRRTWSEYSLKVLGRYETFDEARIKLPKATDTSNLESDDELIKRKRKRQRNRFLMEDEEETSDENCNEETRLPMPPKYKKASNKPSNQEAATLANENTPKSKTPCQDCFSPFKDCSSPRNILQDLPPQNVTEDRSSPQFITTNERNLGVPSRSNDLTLLRRDVLDIKFKLNRLLESFEDLKDKIGLSISTEVLKPTEESEAIISITNKFPLSEDDLEAVESILEDARTKNNLISYLRKYGGSNVKAATFTLLRMMFSDVTGSKYSWVGAKKKKVFSSLRIFEVMSDAIRGRFEATVEEISVHVKTWLRNAPMRILLKSKKNQ